MSRAAVRTRGPFCAVVALAVLAGAARQAPAQEAADSSVSATSPPTAPPPDSALWIAVGVRPRSSVVAATVTFPAGSARDPDGGGGTAWLLARALEAMVQEALGPDATALMTVDRNTFSATLLATPNRWESAFATLTTVLQERDINAQRFEEARSGLLSRMSFEAGAPVRDFELEAARLYAAGEAGWARPPDGSPESLAGLGVDDLVRFRRQHFDAGRAVVGIVGAVDSVGAVGVAADLRRGASSGDSGEATPRGQPWTVRDRVPAVRPITNSALAFAYPLPADHGRTEAEFLAHVLRESLDTDPPDPGVYGVHTAILDGPRGSLIVIEATVFPEVADRWERRIDNAVRIAASTNPDEDVFFPWQRRRFRSTAMADDAPPEGLSLRLTHDLLRAGAPRDLSGEIDVLTAVGMVRLANALGEPHVLFFGPDLADAQER